MTVEERQITTNDLRAAVNAVICAVGSGANLVAQAVTHSPAYAVFGCLFAVLGYFGFRGIGRA